MHRSLAQVAIAAIFLASVTFAESKFVAGDVPGAGIRRPGRIVITNDHDSIDAYQFQGDIRHALLSLRSVRTIRYRPYGGVLYDGSAALDAPIPSELQDIIRSAASTHGVDPRLVVAIARRESSLNASAVSHRGAVGFMQLMPATSQFLGIVNPIDARENIFGGTRYLKMLLQTFRGDLDLTLAAYNAGPGAVARYGGVPPFRETREYVAAVRHSYERSIGR
jgi:Soluble lytic murein transglycosylase and related regulatory proteins (some contain LysM/invasin domains)